MVALCPVTCFRPKAVGCVADPRELRISSPVSGCVRATNFAAFEVSVYERSHGRFTTVMDGLARSRMSVCAFSGILSFCLFLVFFCLSVRPSASPSTVCLLICLSLFIFFFVIIIIIIIITIINIVIIIIFFFFFFSFVFFFFFFFSSSPAFFEKKRSSGLITLYCYAIPKCNHCC